MANSKDQLWQESNEWQGVPKTVTYKETTKGTPYLEVMFMVEGQPKHAKFWLSERAIDSTMARLKDLGFNGNFDDPAITRTTPVRLSCKHNEYNGKWYEEWTFWGEKQAAAPLDRTKAAQLTAQYRSIAGKMPTPATTPTPKAPSSMPPRPTTPPAPIPAKQSLVAHDEATAWAYWCEKTTDEKLRNEGWLQAVDSVKPKSAEDWNKVALIVDIPF